MLKNQKLADCEISRRLQEVRKTVLEEQRTQLTGEKQQLIEDLVRKSPRCDRGPCDTVTVLCLQEKSQSNAEHQR